MRRLLTVFVVMAVMAAMVAVMAAPAFADKGGTPNSNVPETFGTNIGACANDQAVTDRANNNNKFQNCNQPVGGR